MKLQRFLFAVEKKKVTTNSIGLGVSNTFLKFQFYHLNSGSGTLLSKPSPQFAVSASIHLLTPFILHSQLHGRWSLSQLTRGEGGVTPWTTCQFITGSQRETGSHSHSCLHLQTRCSCTRREPGQTLGEHANSAQKGPE